MTEMPYIAKIFWLSYWYRNEHIYFSLSTADSKMNTCTIEQITKRTMKITLKHIVFISIRKSQMQFCTVDAKVIWLNLPFLLPYIDKNDHKGIHTYGWWETSSYIKTILCNRSPMVFLYLLVVTLKQW